MLFGNSHAKPYFLAAIAVLVFAGGMIVGHGLKIVGLGLAAWTVWSIVRDHGRAGVRPSGDRHGS
ncbi:MAG TPA: hypothetical protein VJ741_02860 [Solirubrobacteraceae bacterium]|nr:hypothetical protein [Solirubrobacteraceae bacterium]